MSDEELEELNKEEEMELGKDELEDILYLGQPENEQIADEKPQDKDNKE